MLGCVLPSDGDDMTGPISVNLLAGVAVGRVRTTLCKGIGFLLRSKADVSVRVQRLEDTTCSTSSVLGDNLRHTEYGHLQAFDGQMHYSGTGVRYYDPRRAELVPGID